MNEAELLVRISRDSLTVHLSVDGGDYRVASEREAIELLRDVLRALTALDLVASLGLLSPISGQDLEEN